MKMNIPAKLLLIFAILNVRFNSKLAFDLSSNGTLMECETKASSHDSYNPHSHLNFQTIKDCYRKIRLTLDIENKDKTPEGLQYIFVKDVVEEKSKSKLRLLNPLLFRIRQEQVILAYPFNYLLAVNGKAAEVIINYQNRKNFTGCDDTSQINPTCGLKHVKGVAVPYSEGFCCFCPETPVKETQRRGGQDCSLNIGDPDDYEKQKYKASAHCLHMSDIWYSVSALSEPFLLHEIYLQVYNQRHILNGSSIWVALTHDEDFELGVKNPFQFDENKTIVASYVTANPKNNSGIAHANNRLLIPQPMPSIDPEKIPLAIKNGASDYLLLSKTIISPGGDECDTAGVSYEGFAKQFDRCKVPKDTCLKNQPLDFWEGDDEKRKSGKKGSYLLENFGVPYKDPIIVDSKTKEHWLALEYYEKHKTTLTIEINADNIIALTVGKQAQIASVITSNMGKKIEFYVGILNSGLVAAKLSAQVVQCAFGVPNSNNVSIVVPPQLKEEFVLTTEVGSIELSGILECTVEVSSLLYGTIAKREITVKQHERCICNIHCRCVCLGDSLKCVPMDEEDYHLAGFQGSLPILTAKPPYKPWIVRHPYLAAFLLILLLLLFGLLKGALGCIGFSRIGKFGLETRLYQKKRIPHYFEPTIKDLEVVYDDDGYPINPDTKEHAQVFGEELLFVFNLFFCCLWPLIKIYDCIPSKRDVENSGDFSEDDSSSDSLDLDIGDTTKSIFGGSLPTANAFTGQPIRVESSPHFKTSIPRETSSQKRITSEREGIDQKGLETIDSETPQKPEPLSPKGVDTLDSETTDAQTKQRPKPLSPEAQKWRKGAAKIKTVI